jgi:hypothetical protein
MTATRDNVLLPALDYGVEAITRALTHMECEQCAGDLTTARDWLVAARDYVRREAA